jgi:hypothetical protein
MTVIAFVVVAAALGQAPSLSLDPQASVAQVRLEAECARQVSAARLKQDVETLAAFGTRQTLSDTTSTKRGIGAARRWIKDELDRAGATSGGRMKVEMEEFDVPEAKRIPKGGAHLVNVLGVLRGVDEHAAIRRIYIVGHYDSRNAGEMDGTGDAPGANDDASGTAAVIEAARVLADKPLPCTVVFLATAGEEEGLYGATYRAAQASAARELIVGVLNNDIVGDPALDAGGSLADVRVFSEGLPRNPSAERLADIRAASAESDSPSRELARFVEETARVNRLGPAARLVFRPDRFMRGGDHLPFNDAGFTAVRFTSSAEVYARQHANVTEKDGKPYGDVPAFVDGEYLAGVTRVNVATIVRLAMAPPAPENVRIITAELGNSTTVRWSGEHDTRTRSYALVWRETTEAAWTHERVVGLVSEVTVETSKDDHFFGVRAVGEDGYEGVVAFAWQAKK